MHYCRMSRSAPAAPVFKAIADPTRRAVLRLVRDGERTVSELQRETRTSQSAMSQHLAVLRRARLVQHRQVGRNRWYSLRRPSPLRHVIDWTAYFEGFWDDRLARLRAHLDREASS
jgi:DNA-binding transcriptional ArsR family regulator